MDFYGNAQVKSPFSQMIHHENCGPMSNSQKILQVFFGANPGFRKFGKQENQPWYRHKHVYHIIRQFVYFGCFDLWNFGVTYSRTKPSRIVDYIILSIP
jgi:hypothetical protein